MGSRRPQGGRTRRFHWQNAHNSLAALYFFGDWDCTHGDAESQRAITLDPNYAEAHHLRSYILMAMNRPDEAVREQKRGTEVDPFQRPWALGYTYYHLRQFDAAMTELRLRAAANPNEGSTPFILSDAYWSKGMFQEAVQEVEQGFLIAADRDLSRCGNPCLFPSAEGVGPSRSGAGKTPRQLHTKATPLPGGWPWIAHVPATKKKLSNSSKPPTANTPLASCAFSKTNPSSTSSTPTPATNPWQENCPFRQSS